jgi:alkylhydroperoxidase family enzyme
MPRVREIEEPGDDPTLKEIFAREQQLFGSVLNPTKVQAHTPGIMRAAKQLSLAVEKSALLPPQLLSLIYLRVATINGCPF